MSYSVPPAHRYRNQPVCHYIADPAHLWRDETELLAGLAPAHPWRHFLSEDFPLPVTRVHVWR